METVEHPPSPVARSPRKRPENRKTTKTSGIVVEVPLPHPCTHAQIVTFFFSYLRWRKLISTLVDVHSWNPPPYATYSPPENA
jgi:hypothetical protein